MRAVGAFVNQKAVEAAPRAMQDIIEELIRGLGYLALRLATFGHYQSRGSDSRLVEGAVGFGIVVLGAYVGYTLSAWLAT